MITGRFDFARRVRHSLQAVFAGHHQVENDQVDTRRIEGFPHRYAVGRLDRAEAVRGQIFREQRANFAIVIDDQDQRLRIHGRDYGGAIPRSGSRVYRNVSPGAVDTNRYKRLLGWYTPVHIGPCATNRRYIGRRRWEPCEKHSFPKPRGVIMNSFQKSVVIAVASLGLGTTALAASDTSPSSTDGGSHWGTFGSHGAKSAERVAKRQAALHDKLSLSPAQEAAWKTYTEKLQATAPARPEGASTVTMTAPERADRMVTFLQVAQQRAVCARPGGQGVLRHSVTGTAKDLRQSVPRPPSPFRSRLISRE
jgi:hypothetical protein